MAKTTSFKQAFERLQEISQLLDDEEVIDVDELLKIQKEAKELYTFCSEKLEGASVKLTDDRKKGGVKNK